MQWGGRVDGVVRALFEQARFRILQRLEGFDPALTLAGLLRKTADRVEDVGGVGAAIGVEAEVTAGPVVPVPAAVSPGAIEQVVGHEGFGLSDELPQIDHEVSLPFSGSCKLSRACPGASPTQDC
jgi:hypothetical protein